MQFHNFNQHITQLLKADNRLVDEENDIQINVLRDLVNNLDSQLIELLIADDKVREKFFIQIKDVYVFKQNDFIFYLDSKVLDGSYTQYANRIGLASGGKFLTDSTDYVLDFPYKDCVLEGGQSTEEGNDIYFEFDADANDYVEKSAKRKEIFYNNIIAKDEIDRLLEPKAFQKVVRYDANGETIPSSFTRDAELNRQRGLPEDTITDNLIIKGNNLLALHSLEKEFKGKVKLIYIDPPYNTGNDSFAYNDKFNHSAWLTFMYNRLSIAKRLLTDDGSICINLDDKEAHYCKILSDLIFGRENFISNIIWQKKFSPQNDARYFSDNHDHIIVYSKNKINYQINLLPRTEELNSRYKNIDNDPRGPWSSSDMTVKTYSEDYDYPITTPNGKIVNPPKSRCWRTSKDNFQKLIEDNRIWFGEDGGNVPRLKRFLTDVKDGITPMTIWLHSEVGHNQDARKEIVNIIEGDDFATPKPEKLIERIIHIGSNENDLVLDYHLGSGTTAAVAHKMNRQYIGIEQMDYIETIPLQRLKKVIGGEQGGISKAQNWQGGGSFVYAELAKNNETAKERIEACNTLEDLLQLFEELNTRYFLDYNVRIKDFKENVIKEEAFINLSLARQKKLFKRMLDNNQLYVNLSEVEDARYNLSEDAIRLTKDFYQIKN